MATASVTPMDIPSATKASARLDLIGKRILRSLSHHVDVDVAGLAQELGASEDVVRSRVRAMRESGLLQGFRPRLDARQVGQTFEFLVTGVPTDRTDRDALGGLCADAQVTRAFGLASAHSVAFTVIGRDLAATRAHGLALAARAGLRQAQAALVVATFEDRAGGYPAEPEPATVRAAASTAPATAPMPGAVASFGQVMPEASVLAETEAAVAG